MKRNGTYKKLLLSYVLVIAFVAILISVPMTVYNTVHTVNQIKVGNAEQLLNIQKTIETSLLEEIMSLSFDLSSTNTVYGDIRPLFYQDVTIQSAATLDTIQALKKIVSAKDDVIKAIYIYNMDKRLLVTNYGAEEMIPGQLFRMPAEAVKFFVDNGCEVMWTPVWTLARSFDTHEYDNEVFSFVRTYPYSFISQDFEGIIMVHVKEKAIREILEGFNLTSLGNVWIMDRDYHLVSAIQSEEATALLQEYASEFQKLSPSDELWSWQTDDQKYLMTYTYLEECNWYLVSCAPTPSIYKNLYVVIQFIAVWCVIALVAGIALTTLITSRFYLPIKKLTSNVLPVLPGESQDSDVQVISAAIERLRNENHDLQSALETNRKVLQHNLICTLLLGRETRSTTLSSQLQRAKIPVEGGQYAVLVFEFPAEVLEHLQAEELLWIRYALIQHLEKISDQVHTLLPVDLTEQQIACLVVSKIEDQAFLGSCVQNLLSYCMDTFKLTIFAAVSESCDDVMKISEQYHLAVQVLSYRTLYPNRQVYSVREFIAQMGCRRKFPSEYCQAVCQAIAIRNLTFLQNTMEVLCHEFENHMYSMDSYCQVQQTIWRKLQECKQEIHVSAVEGKEWTVLPIEEFKKAVFQFFTETIMPEMTVENQESDKIARVKAYIDAHLDGDVTLLRLSEEVHISPQYLCKIFKAETNCNIADYINERRMERAVYYIKNTQISVSDIALKVGFGSSAYFIKKFKMRFGVTPKKYQDIVRNRHG